MKPYTVLTLGDFEFARYEIPEKITFGGEQALAVHELVGGVRVVDAMGRIDGPLEWSGLFIGETALERARYLDGLRIAGKELTLFWSELAYRVVIKSFRCDFEKSYKLPYSISCIVVEDLYDPPTEIAPTGVDEWIADDMAEANALGDLIGDGPLSGLLGTLDSAISTVSSFANAVQSTINGVLAPLAAVQARVQILIGSVGNVVSNVTTLGGILPNNPIAQQAAKLTGQVTAMTQLPQLYNLQSVLGRMGGNLGSIVTAGRQVAVAGGNLYQMAADAYNDASRWTTIAKANGLTDPVVQGVQTVTVPPTADDSGGVMYA
ncbi:MAG: hypothetical protein VB138_01510 [Burkholderia sp.]